jgi:hypothetical protein
VTSDLIATKVVNVLVPDAELNPRLRRWLNFQSLGSFGLSLKLVRQAYGGLWVGGNLCLYRDHLSFEPNAANRSVHSSDLAQKFSLSAATTVESRFGFLSGIIDVESAEKRLTFRCYGSAAFAKVIREAAAARR